MEHDLRFSIDDFHGSGRTLESVLQPCSSLHATPRLVVRACHAITFAGL